MKYRRPPVKSRFETAIETLLVFVGIVVLIAIMFMSAKEVAEWEWHDPQVMTTQEYSEQVKESMNRYQASEAFSSSFATNK